MACRDAPSFEEYIREWMYGTSTEAAQEIYDLARDGTSLSSAVALVIESLPSRKTAQLRRLVELFEPWCEWKEDWESKGWHVTKYDKDSVAATAPESVFNRLRDTMSAGQATVLTKDFPDEEVVAAAQGVSSVEFSFIAETDWAIGAVYRLGRSL